MRILRLNKAGSPLGWITIQEAAELYAKDQVVWSLGDTTTRIMGGTNKSGQRSYLDISPIIASEGRVIDNCLSISLSNRALFRRDGNLCLYCGEEFDDKKLTRDHIIPKGQGGEDNWMNVVAACEACNGKKACQTPEEAEMPLLATPFRPNPWEWAFLVNRNVLADQMLFLKTRFKNDRGWSN